jgi:hypothetical protein
MTLLSGDPQTQLAFSVYENKGVFALLIGSGLSRSAEIPTGWEITLDLVRRVALAQGVPEQPDWAKWHRDKTGQEPDYSALLGELAASPDERRAILHSYIEPTEDDRREGRKVPTVAHHAIAALVRAGYIRVIVTTNFDRLLENALREAGVEPTVIASVDALTGAEPVVHTSCYILKLHGDYKDARIRNIDSELSAYPPAFDTLLNRIFDEHGLIVAGWSGEWDHALRAAFLRAPNRRYPVYWTVRSKIGNGAQAIIDQRKARVVTATDADSFFKGLEQRVETLAQSRKQNPLSIDLIVGTAKRYLARPEHRIQLDDLVSQEFARLMSQLNVPELKPQGSWSKEEFRDRLRRYEAATEPLARVMGVLGRWGDGSEFPVVADAIRSVCSHAEKEGSGLTVWLGLRSYPAVLMFTAYGLGLTRSQRWKTLHDLFTAKIAREDREPKRTVEHLFLWRWKGQDQEVWKQIERLDNRHTPLSDYLFELFSDWSASFAAMTPEFEILFERFEFLGALAYMESTSEADAETTLADSQGRVWMPIGRAGWHSASFRQLTAELQDELGGDILGAGFAHGSIKYLDLFIKNATRLSSRMSW